MLEFYQQMACALQQGTVVLATVVHVKGSVPREVGAKMLLCADHAIIGTVGGGAGEAKVIQQALQVLESGQKQMVEIDLTGSPQRNTQGVCGGSMQVWLERWQGETALSLVQQMIEYLNSGRSVVLVTPLEDPRSPHLDHTMHPTSRTSQPTLTTNNQQLTTSPHSPSFTETLLPPPTLLIIGAGHCAVPLAHLAHLTGFRVIVQDDRPEFANRSRFPDAARLLAKPIAEAISTLSEIAQLYAALVTRGFTHDLEALQALAHCSTEYIGMIGSEQRVRTVFQALQKSDPKPDPAFLAQIYAPIGLDIGALTPAEIAVSICAELIKVRRGGTGRSLSDKLRQAHSRANELHKPLAGLKYAQPPAQQ